MELGCVHLTLGIFLYTPEIFCLQLHCKKLVQKWADFFIFQVSCQNVVLKHKFVSLRRADGSKALLWMEVMAEYWGCGGSAVGGSHNWSPWLICPYAWRWPGCEPSTGNLALCCSCPRAWALLRESRLLLWVCCSQLPCLLRNVRIASGYSNFFIVREHLVLGNEIKCLTFSGCHDISKWRSGNWQYNLWCNEKSWTKGGDHCQGKNWPTFKVPSDCLFSC